MTVWDEVWAWAAAVWESGWGVPLRVAVIVLAALLIRFIARRLIRASVRRIADGVRAVTKAEARVSDSPIDVARRVQRTRTLGRIFDNAASTAIVVVALLAIVYTLWPGATSAFALIAAGVGAGVGIGAQGLVKDVLNGIFFAAEDQLGIGDVVDVGVTTGVVEDLGVRMTQIRDVKGTLWFVPNGQITSVGNMSHGWARAIIDLQVPYASDVAGVQRAVADAGAALAADPAWAARIIEPPEVWGIQSLTSDAIVLRAVAKTKVDAQDAVAREFRARIKAAVDDADVLVWPPSVVRLDGGEAAP